MEKIKELRDRTGAGIVDCKKTLEESNGDIEKAIEFLRKKGISKAAKRVGREASEGIIKIRINDSKTEGFMIKLNSETDFVAKNEKFQNFAEKVLDIIIEKKPENLDNLLETPMESGTIKEELESLSGIIGEKMTLSDFTMISGQTVSGYSHLDGKIGVLVALNKENQSDLATDIAMQIAATNPSYKLPEEVPTEELEKEKIIYKEQLLKEEKPENIIENILKGKVEKYYSENCLIKQEFIKEEKKTVEEILNGIKVDKFIRFSL